MEVSTLVDDDFQFQKGDRKQEGCAFRLRALCAPARHDESFAFDTTLSW